MKKNETTKPPQVGQSALTDGLGDAQSAKISITCELHIRDAQSLLMLLRREREHDYRRRGEKELPPGALQDIRRLHEDLEQLLLMRHDA